MSSINELPPCALHSEYINQPGNLGDKGTNMYDLHAYARARQIEMEQALRRYNRSEESWRPSQPRQRAKLVRIFFGESPQSRAA